MGVRNFCLLKISKQNTLNPLCTVTHISNTKRSSVLMYNPQKQTNLMQKKNLSFCFYMYPSFAFNRFWCESNILQEGRVYYYFDDFLVQIL